MKQIILSSTCLEFTWVVMDDFVEEHGSVPSLLKLELGPLNTEGS